MGIGLECESGFESIQLIFMQFWGVAKRPKAPDFDSGIRRFESSHPSQQY